MSERKIDVGALRKRSLYVAAESSGFRETGDLKWLTHEELLALVEAVEAARLMLHAYDVDERAGCDDAANELEDALDKFDFGSVVALRETT